MCGLPRNDSSALQFKEGPGNNAGRIEEKKKNNETLINYFMVEFSL